MSASHADRNLLFGIVALQMDFITRDQLVGGMNAWVLDKSRPLGQILVDLGHLSEARRGLLEPLVDEHVRQHGNDPAVSLAALSSSGGAVDALRPLGDPDLQASLVRVASPEVAPTITQDAASWFQNLRFRILRPHARGGLGQVYVARDQELGRQVALKEIRSDKADSDSLRNRFVLEAEINGNLEHPGIVPVYGLGTYPDGRPFYAMRFIQGDSLQDAIARFHAETEQKAQSPARELRLRKLLGRFIDVCEAIAYAHSRGVLHRDLKPANIMLGKYGETLVVDWGLAKAMGKPGETRGHESTEATFIPSSGSHAPTLAGSALGTPQYMSPEQAEGRLDELGPATDIYALGATLYNLLTGKPPIDSDEVGEVLRRVVRGDIPPPRQHNRRIPRALEAVCLKALSLKPEHRYATARALADDLERWLGDEPVSAHPEPLHERARRWTRKHKTLVTSAAAVLVAAVVALSAISTVLTQARDQLAAKNVELDSAYAKVLQTNQALTLANAAIDQQRRRSEGREQQAIQAVKRFRDAVAGDPTLKNALELQPLRKRLLQEPLAFFTALRNELLADRDTSPEALGRLGSAAYELGQLTDSIDDKQNALVAFNEAASIFQSFTESHPEDERGRRMLADSLQQIGSILTETGQLKGALERLEQVAAIRERLAEIHPDDISLRAELAFTRICIATVHYNTGKPVAALADYEAARTALESCLSADPAHTRSRELLARAHDGIASVRRDLGEPERALEAYNHCLRLRQKLRDEDPTNPQNWASLARSHNNRALVLRETGKLAESLREFELARDQQRGLADQFPSTTLYQSDLGITESNIGLNLRDLGRIPDAIEANSRARAIFQALVESNPTVTQYQLRLAQSNHRIGMLLFSSGQIEDGMRAVETAQVVYRKLVESSPSEPEFQFDLAATHLNMGNLLLWMRRADQAMEQFESAIGLLKQLAEANPDNVSYQRDLARALLSVASAHDVSGRLADALEPAREASEIARKLVEKNPSVTELVHLGALSNLQLGNVLHANSRADQARAFLEETILTFESLVGRFPKSSTFISQLSAALSRAGEVELDRDQFAAAAALADRARDQAKEALALNPRDPVARSNLDRTRQLQLQIAEARDDTSTTQAIQKEMLKALDDDPRMQAAEKRLAEVVEGAQPTDQDERLRLAIHASTKGYYRTSVRLLEEALAVDPKLPADFRSGAAFAAVLACTDQGKEAALPDDHEKAEYRTKALGWLNQVLDEADSSLPKADEPARKALARTLKSWKAEPSLVSVREPEMLEKLPETEATAWKTFWARLGALLVSLEGRSPP